MDLWPSEAEERTAIAVLGPGEPLAVAISRRRIVGRQALVAAAPLPGAVAAVLLDVDIAPVVLGVILFVASAFLGLWLSAGRTLRDRTEEHLARDEGGLALPVVVRERRRLRSRRERERLALSLEHALEDARRWHRFPPRSRPLYGVQFLRDSAAEVNDIAAKLRTQPVRIQGVALVSRLLVDGAKSPLYSGDSARLRAELRRIRELLGPRRPSPLHEHTRHAA